MRLAVTVCTVMARAALLAALLATIAVAPAARAEMKLEDYAVGNYPIGGDFTLTNHNGGKTSLEEFRGKVVLLAFGYTHCPDVCPTTLTDFKRVKAGLGDRGGQLQALFVSVDPKRDTPKLLKQYVGHFDPSFVGLTGDEAALEQVTGQYMAKFRYRDGGSASGYLVDHTAFVYLIDLQGTVRYLFTPDVRSDMILAGVRAVLDGQS